MSDYYQQNERDLTEFTRREVIYCVSSLVSELARKDDSGTLLEEFPDLFQGAPSFGDWTCSECFNCWEGEPDDSECPECKQESDPEPNHTSGGSYISGFEPTEYSEIYEHWIVSEWLAGKLAGKGEAVEKDFYGLTVWGRSCTGQGIALDGVISEIHKDLHSK